jgi:4-aminobutyrate aminotransferase
LFLSIYCSLFSPSLTPRARSTSDWDVRGLGLMNALEFHRGKDKSGIAADVAQRCVDKGMLLLPTGAWDTIRFMPPLNVSEAEVDEALAIFEDATREAYAARR